MNEKKQRGRPRKIKPPVEKLPSHRPSRQSTLERDQAIMTAAVVLEYYGWTGMKRRKLLEEIFPLSDKAIDAAITKLNKLMKEGKVSLLMVNGEPVSVGFGDPENIKQYGTERGLFYEGTNPDGARIFSKHYDISKYMLKLVQ